MTPSRRLELLEFALHHFSVRKTAGLGSCSVHINVINVTFWRFHQLLNYWLIIVTSLHKQISV
jgi:hypothetical protein